MDLLPGVTTRTVDTDRLRLHVYEAGPQDGVPVLLVHGNLSTGRFYEHVMSGAPRRYRFLAPDMRGFGRSEPVPIDATRGLADWADDLHAMVQELGIDRPVHLVGWSTGGAAIASYARARPAASLTLVDPVSPFGYGGVKDDGSPVHADFAGSGGGTANPDFVVRLRAGDRSAESPLSPRSVLRTTYWSPAFTLDPAREDVLVDEVLLSVIGDDGYPGDATPSDDWPGTAPGSRGILNALSPKHCDWTGLVDVDPKPPVLWTQGTDDIVIADGSPLEMGTLGAAGVVPGWPGPDVFPPQQMVSQIRAVLERYRDAGGEVQVELIEGSGHGPFVDAAQRWTELLLAFLDRAEAGRPS